MTTINFDSETLTLTADGHAGDNLVCAAVSMLMFTLRERLYEQQEELGGIEINETLGDGHISVSASCGDGDYYTYDVVLEAFEFAMTGARMLARRYPENVCAAPPLR